MMTTTRRLVLKLVRFQNRLDVLNDQFAVAYGYDSAFDGGEFSGPAIEREMARAEQREAERIGFTCPRAVGDAIRILGCDMRATVGGATYGAEGYVSTFGQR